MMGQIGDGRRVFDAADPAFLQPTPMRVAGITDVLEVAVGPSMVCAMRRDNSIWCWGLNNNAPLPWASNTVSVPVQVMAADGG